MLRSISENCSYAIAVSSIDIPFFAIILSRRKRIVDTSR